MITLTTPPSVNSVLGGASPISYNKLVISHVGIDVINQKIVADIQISPTANPDMQPIPGTLSIHIITAKLTIAVQQLDFYRQVTLTSPQLNSVLTTIIQPAQNTLESGLITLGVIAGVQTTGV